MKIHILSSSLRINSGFSIVARNIALGLKKLNHIVTMTGLQTSYIPEFAYGIENLPIQTHFIDDMTQYMMTLDRIKPDIVMNIFQADYEFNDFPKVFKKSVWYPPVEGRNIPQKMANDLLAVKMNGGEIVAQTKYGQGEIQLALGGIDIPYIYHGFDDKIFRPLNIQNSDEIRCCYYSTDNGKLNSDPLTLHKQGCYDCQLSNKEQSKCPYYKDEQVSALKFINGKWTEESMSITDLPKYTKGKFVFGFVGQNLGVRKRIERLLKAYSIFIKDSRQLKDRTCIHLHCLTSESPILTLDRGVQRIKNIKIGDKVLTHKGRFMKVSQVMKREYSGDIIKIIPKKINVPIMMTPDHPVLAVKTELCSGTNSRENSICIPGRTCYYTKSTGVKTKHCKHISGEEPFRMYRSEWINAGNLRVGDLLTYPRINGKDIDIEKIRILDHIDDFLNTIGDSYDDSSIQTDIFGGPVKKTIVMNNPYSIKNCQIPAEVELTGGLMRLFGYFISDGDDSGNSIEFTFNIGEEEYIEDIKVIMKNIFGLDYSYRMRDHAHVLIYPNRVLQNMFRNMFCPDKYRIKTGKGSKANIVRIPSEFLLLPLNKLSELIKGIWRGDGTRSQSGYSITTTSETLAWQLVYIFSRFNILSAIRIEKPKIENHAIKYHIEFYGKDADIFDNIIGEKHPNRHNIEDKDSVYLKGKNLYYTPIRDIEIIRYRGDVFNLEVEEDNSYVSTITLHNCMPIAINGINLIKVIQELGIQGNVIFSYGTHRSSAWTDEAMNILYNTFDVNTSASSSEGFCILPDSSIFTLDRGVQKIKNIKVGDKILTHKGRFRKVSQVMKREYNGDMIKITSHKMGIPIVLTPEHRLLGIRTVPCTNKSGGIIKGKAICKPGQCYYMKNGIQYKWCKYIDGEEPYRRYKTEWISAGSLEIGDFLTYPRANENVIDIDEIKIRDYIDDFLNVIGGEYSDSSKQSDLFGSFVEDTICMNANYSRKYAKIPAKIKLDDDLMKLFGYFIAEGDIAGERQIEFSFNINELEYVEDVERIMKEKFGLDTEHIIDKKKNNEKINVHILRYSNKVLSNMFQNMFCPKEYIKRKGKGSKSNIVRIPPEFLNLPLDKLAKLIKAEWRGDGTEFASSGGTYQITTTSETLAHQLLYILSRFGILASFRVADWNSKQNENWSLQYNVEIHGKDIEIFNSIIDQKNEYRNIKEDRDSKYLKGKNLYYTPIKDIDIIKYNGDVCNLEVEEDNSYVSSVVLHNCLPVIEGFAAGIPMIAPNCSSFTELIGEGPKTRRGLLALVIDWQMIQDGSIRAIVSEADLAYQMKLIYQDGELREHCSKNAIKFVQNYTWEKIVKEWDQLIKNL